MKIAVVVVNYGTAALAVDAVQSVLDRAEDGHDVKTYLVDNASPGDDAAILKREHDARGWHGFVDLKLEATNHGFGRGNNVVLTQLAEETDPPDFVLLLNPDAQLAHDAIAHLANALNENGALGAAGAAVTLPDTTPLVAAFRFPNFVSEMLRIANFGPLDKIFGQRRTSLPLPHNDGIVDWVTGAAVMFRFQALKQVGFFDPGFFLYYEEVELMHRLGKAGWPCAHVGSAKVVHDEGASTGGGGLRRSQPAYLYDSWRHYFVQTRGRIGALVLACGLMPFAAFNVLHRKMRGKQPTIPEGYFRDQWKLVIRPLVAGKSSA